jgi:hypothetical protein
MWVSVVRQSFVLDLNEYDPWLQYEYFRGEGSRV